MILKLKKSTFHLILVIGAFVFNSGLVNGQSDFSVNMCESSVTSESSGHLYDSGGPNGEYSNNEYCSVLISPGCTQDITFTIEEISTNLSDIIRVYDGANSDAPQILFANISSDPPAPVTGTSGELFVVFTTNGNQTNEGFHATWIAETAFNAPEAFFSVSDPNPALNTEVNFTDLSSEFPGEWAWDFGDGSTSSEMNPTHSYSTPGEFTVTLTSTNCFASDTYSQTIEVQEAPAFSINPADTLEQTIYCGGEISTELTIHNTGQGDLSISLIGDSNSSPVPTQILAFKTAISSTGPYNNTIDAISSVYTDFELYESYATTAEELETNLDGIDILLIPSPTNYAGGLYNLLSEVIISFVEQGGKVLICNNQSLNSLGLFEFAGTIQEYGGYPILNVAPNHPIMSEVPLEINSLNETRYHNWSSDGSTQIFATSGFNGDYHTVATRSIEAGTAAYVGFDFYQTSDTYEQILGNTAKYLATALQPSWFDSFLMDSTVVISPGDSLVLEVQLNADELSSGDYFYDVNFLLNEPGLDSVNYVFHLEVISEANLTTSLNEITFEPLVEGFSSSAEVPLYNNGCEDLNVIASLTNSTFEVQPQSITIPAYSHDTLLVAFSPDSPEQFTDQLQLESNGGNTVIQLSGEGLSAPTLDVSPTDTLHVSTLCGQSTQASVVFSNSGPGELNFSLEEGTATPQYPLDILMLRTQTNTEYYNDVYWAINQFYDDFILVDSYAQSSDQLLQDLEHVDVLIIPHQIDATSVFFSNLSSAFVEYAESGGNIVIAANYSLGATGLFDVESPSEYSTEFLNSTDPEHPLMHEVAEQFNSYGGISYQDWNSDEGVELLLEYESDFITTAFSNFGEGKVLYLGSFFDGPSFNEDKILGNALNLFSESAHPNWITDITPTNDVWVSTNDSISITFEIDSESQMQGDYYYDLEFTTNDPLLPQLNYTIHLENLPFSDFDVLEDQINFDPLITGLSSEDTILIFNTACETLTGTVNSTASDFVVQSEEFSIPPYSTDSIIVEFTPLSEGVIEGELLLSSNGGDTLISLFGEGLPAPELVLPTDFVNIENPYCEDSLMVSFDIFNEGGGNLSFSVTSNRGIPLDSVISLLDSNHQSVTDLISDIYLFNEGESGSMIEYGNYAMYNNGNILNTNFQLEIPYTSSSVIQDNYFGDNTSYFTAKYPGLFVMAADYNQLEMFSVNGQLGQEFEDRDAIEFTYEHISGYTYTALITRYQDSYAPSINHMVITEQSPNLAQTYSTEYFLENHEVTGFNETGRLYYLLFATEEGYPVSDTELEEVFRTFVDLNYSTYPNLGMISGEVDPFDTTTIEFYIPTEGYEIGVHEIPIIISSNEPNAFDDSLLVNLEIPGNACSGFSIEQISPCSNHYSFTNESQFNPTSWSWDFGDGTTSNEVNPTHHYSMSGEYEVTLGVCNASGCNTSTQIITVSDNSSNYGSAIECSPIAQDSLAEYYISEVQLSSFSHESEGSTLGYEDFSCDEIIPIIANSQYSLEINFEGFSGATVQVWIDMDNDYELSEDERYFYEYQGSNESSGSIIIPNDAVLNIPLRMRVMVADSWYEPCEEINFGEIEDYTVIISSGSVPPIATFTQEEIGDCEGEFQFTDLSGGAPYGWLWSFGDGNTSNEQNPVHDYSSSGVYTVELTVINQHGNDSYEYELTIDPLGIEGLIVENTSVIDTPTNFEAPADGVTEWNWDFGDGETESSTSPQVEHVYSNTGLFSVIVTTDDDVCRDSVMTQVEVFPTNIEELSENHVIVYPNPTQGKITLSYSETTSLVGLSIVDALGKQVSFQMSATEKAEVDIRLEDAEPGIYFISGAFINGSVFQNRIILKN